jgi:small subunit ribosomal protein S4
VDIPSFEVRAGDIVQLRQKAKKIVQVQAAVASAQARGIPEWLQIDPENFSGNVISLPIREHITLPIQEQLIVELYSK